MSMQNIGGLSGFSYFSSVKFQARAGARRRYEQPLRALPRVHREQQRVPGGLLHLIYPRSVKRRRELACEGPVNTAASRGIVLPS